MKARKRVVTGAVPAGRRTAPKRAPTVRRIRSAIVPAGRAAPAAGGPARSIVGPGPPGATRPASATVVDLHLELASRTGLSLDSPILVAAGAAGYGTELAGTLELDGVGAIVTRTTTLRPRDGAPPPRLVALPNAVVWATGFPNPGVDAVVERFSGAWSRLGPAIVVSVGGETAGEVAEVARRLDEVPGVAALELNLAELRPGPVDPSALATLVGAVRRATERPLFVKLPVVEDVRRLGRAVVEAGADGLVGPGGLRARALVPTAGGATARALGLARRPALGAGRGFLAGPAALPLGLDVVADLAAAVPVPVVAVGGVRSLADVLDYLAVGAAAVAVGTAALADPGRPAQLVEELRAACLAAGLADLGALLAELRRGGAVAPRGRTLAP